MATTTSHSRRKSQPFQGEYNFGDSSGPLFSIYSKAAEDEDDEMVERWQKDADGILIFTGLFSAAVAALLAVTVQDLKPNSQDISAFYLGNIYEFLADPNITRAFIPSPIAKPRPFSPPRYAIWVNSLWFLSLVMSVSCALWATSLHQWARRYIRVTQPSRCSPEKRARMRAFFAGGVDKMHIPWAVEGLPTLLHLSLFLFFGGLVILLFNINHAVFGSVVCWIGLFSIVYGMITLLPLIRQDSPYYAPLSIPTWFLYAGIPYVTFKVLASIADSYQTWERRRDLRDSYRGWMLEGMEKKAEETAEERSSEIDVRILDWTIGALGDDDSLEKFFEAIPGFFNSKLVNDLREYLPEDLSRRLLDALDGFLGRTLSSNSVIDSVKLRRLDVSLNAINVIRASGVSSILQKILSKYWDQVPKTVEMGHTLAHWCTNSDRRIAQYAQCMVTGVLATVRERDDRWVELAARIFGQPERDFRDNITHGSDSVSLSILIQVTRNTLRCDFLWDVLTRLSKLDICNTLPGLQHDFCTLWNNIVQEATNQEHLKITPVYMLREIRHLYIALHQGTDAAPTAFSISTDDSDLILFEPSSYPLCNIATHRPNSTAVPNPRAVPHLTQPRHLPGTSPHQYISGGSTVSRQVREVGIIAGPSDLTAPSEIGDSSQSPETTLPAFPVHTIPRPTDASPPGVVLQGIPPSTPLSHPLEETTQQVIVAPCAEPDSEVLSTAPTPTPTPTPVLILVSTPPALATSSAAGVASTSNPLLPDSHPLSRVSPLQMANVIALLSGTTPSRPIDSDTLPRLRARGLVNSENICFANAVLQLLVHCPPFWNLFRDLGGLMGQQGLGQRQGTGGGATPLVDAKVKFLGEFVYKETLSGTQQLQQRAARGMAMGNEEGTKEDDVVSSFNPRYMYDAMKEKRQLKHLLDGKHQDAEEFLCLYLAALDEELIELHTYISIHKPTSAPNIEELKEEAQSVKGQTELGKRNYTASSAESPISCIFGGRSCSTVRAPSRPDTVTTEAWRLLQLNIQPDSVRTIQDALAQFSQPQPVQVGQSSLSDASQQVLIELLPPVLVLHLKRFLYDVAADGIVKVSKPVHFEPELEIPLDVMALDAGKPAESGYYKLYGVLYHHGESADSGHYTVDVLHLNGESDTGEAWLHIDDEVVSAVRHEDVFGDHDNERRDNRCAYMLFYCRTAPTQT